SASGRSSRCGTTVSTAMALPPGNMPCNPRSEPRGDPDGQPLPYAHPACITWVLGIELPEEGAGPQPIGPRKSNWRGAPLFLEAVRISIRTRPTEVKTAMTRLASILQYRPVQQHVRAKVVILPE